ncbi:MAG: hypothetical protein IT472_11365 [Thermomonas sp.]|uniref:hypothetical protein n=1 Tax=Thermomonas sp. TaxID=1971895 RepID=UPI002603F086|nr:hypothetical protein [Thermomonas sp.]MCC7097767.1 hypothetical protein [Thermomonas sp.]
MKPGTIDKAPAGTRATALRAASTRAWPRLVPGLLLVLCLSGGPGLAAGKRALAFEAVVIGGMSMQLPRGWQRQQDEASLVLTRDPGDEDSPALALFAVQVEPARSPAPATLADAVLAQLDLPAQGVRAVLAEERWQNGALYRLHRLDEAGQRGYLVSYTHVDGGIGISNTLSEQSAP